MENNAYLLAYKRSYRKLLLVLPIDTLVPLIKDKDWLTRVKSDATRQERSRCLLEFVMEELKEERTASFEQLLEVMAAQVDASNNIVLDRVLQSIHMDVKAIISQSEQVPRDEELVPNLKEQFLQQLKQEVSSYTTQLSTDPAGVIWSSGLIKQDVYPDRAIFDHLTRAEAISMLSEKQYDGMYLIRNSPIPDAEKILSVWTGGRSGRARHYKIFYDQSMQHYSLAVGNSFTSIPTLLTHYYSNSLPRLDVSLTVPYGTIVTVLSDTS
ncbi:uncharacterized protein [Dysidea avara]|uniref:uncharacterized protein n=1 Tax=Dysidea avara TaxID=196820 RepID=UPI0033227964